MTTLVFRDELNRDLLQLFNAPTLRAIARGERPALLTTLAAQGITDRRRRVVTTSSLYQHAYDHLWRRYRAEYVYKNVIAERILLGRHSIRTTRMLNEFRVGTSKIDVLLVNGTTTGYEIKTELDSLDRLPDQLDAYCRALDRVYVVTHRSMVERMLRVTRLDVGVLEITEGGSIREHRASASHSAKLDSQTVFEALRRHEYLALLEEAGSAVDQMPNTQLFGACSALFARLAPGDLHSGFVTQLRRRTLSTAVQELVTTAPAPLKALCISAGLTDQEALLLPKHLTDNLLM